MRKTGTIRLEFLHNPFYLGLTQIPHHIKGTFSETEGDLATEVEVFLCAYPPVNDIKGLGEKDTQHPVPYGLPHFIADLHLSTRTRRQPPVNRAQDRRRFIMGPFFHLEGISFNDNRIPVCHVQHKERACKYELPGHPVDLPRRSIVQEIGCIIAPVIKDPV